NTRERMTEITFTLLTMVLGYPQVQGHHLIPLAGVLYRPEMRGLNPQAIALTMFTRRPVHRLCPDFDPFPANYPFNLKVRYAYNSSCVGHRYSPSNCFFANSV
ncbi:hypothetical protein, partial [Zhongshania sp.]|uniref:hypothetical protein n=1 Tax=Zhongshania sp. TaxID=1971902 RepID=UPI003561E05C